MSKRSITEDVYNRILAEFRKNTDHPYAVAKAAKVDPKTALRAWELGWPRKNLDPIKEVIAREQVKARAQIVAQQAARKASLMQEREKALEQAAKARAQEGQMVGLVRGSSLQALTISVSLIGAARQFSEKVKKRIEEQVNLPDGDPKQLSAERGVTLLRQIVALQAQINNTARDAFDLERIHLGQPLAHIGVITNQTEMSIDEAAARIEMAQHALDSARRVGGLTVIDGGQNKPTIGKLVTPDAIVAPDSNAGGTSTKANIR